MSKRQPNFTVKQIRDKWNTAKYKEMRAARLSDLLNVPADETADLTDTSPVANAGEATKDLPPSVGPPAAKTFSVDVPEIVIEKVTEDSPEVSLHNQGWREGIYESVLALRVSCRYKLPGGE